MPWGHLPWASFWNCAGITGFFPVLAASSASAWHLRMTSLKGK